MFPELGLGGTGGLAHEVVVGLAMVGNCVEKAIAQNISAVEQKISIQRGRDSSVWPSLGGSGDCG